MSATNHTTNYELPIFIGTDKPAWLVDWNGAMNAIDTAIKQAETKADSAGTDIGSIQGDIVTINGALTTLNGAVSQLRLDTNANTGSINTITELIGNGTPTTTDKTIIGAINEINSEVYDFNLSQKTVALTSTHGTFTVEDISALLNSAGSVGKVYGNIKLSVTSDIPADSAIATIEITGLDTQEAYDIKGYQMGFYRSTSDYASDLVYLHFNVGNTVEIRRPNTVTYSATTQTIWVNLPPCLLFLKDLGD